MPAIRVPESLGCSAASVAWPVISTSRAGLLAAFAVAMTFVMSAVDRLLAWAVKLTRA
jgi:hypothetical protein